MFAKNYISKSFEKKYVPGRIVKLCDFGTSILLKKHVTQIKEAKRLQTSNNSQIKSLVQKMMIEAFESWFMIGILMHKMIVGRHVFEHARTGVFKAKFPSVFKNIH
uniref:Protein kinase domain-containing protein n=1 Tax=Ditylenchus dipsaci TaxID=166011 RepID=A0A915EUA4_9BILA